MALPDSLSDALADAIVLVLIDQREAYGQWHIQSCWFIVGEFLPSMAPVLITNQMLYDADIRANSGIFSRRRGCRPLTPEETARYHRTLTCWEACKAVQTYEPIPGLTRHIVKSCTPRCLGTAAAVRAAADLLGYPVSVLRQIAKRRHNLGRYADGRRKFPVRAPQQPVMARRRVREA